MNNIEKKTRASGAGVRPSDGCYPLNRKQVLLDEKSEAILLKIGRGNMSLGIREAARRLVDKKDTRPFSATLHEERG